MVPTAKLETHMITKAKSNSVITHKLENNVITFTVRDAGEFTLDMGKLSTAVRDRAAVHGMIQRISDRAAISRDEKTGLSATPESKLAAMQNLADFYMTGTEDWSPSRVSTKRELTAEEKKALMAKWAAEMGMELPL